MIRFGTDGWRAVIAKDFTFQNVKRVAQAYVGFLKAGKFKKKEAVLGFDTRFLSREFAQTFASVLAANAVKVSLFKSALPTPCLCFAVRKSQAAGGVMITASHNPPQFNGIKIKTEIGGPASPQETDKIERLIDKFKIKEMDYIEAVQKGLIREVEYREAYLKFLKKYINFDLISRVKFNVLHDAMYGTGDNLLVQLFNGTKCKFSALRSERNPSFKGISPEPIPKNLASTLKIMQDDKYDICLVTDGDSDRIAAVLPGGRFLNPGWIMSLLLLHFIKHRKQKGAVVKTISNTTLIEKIAQKYAIKLFETPVGFKYIAEVMKNEDILIGGEESGGIGFKNYIPERDGLLSGLLLLEMMAYEKKSINQIIQDVEKEFGKFNYRRIDIHFPDKLKPLLFKKLKSQPFKKILNLKVVQIKTYDGVKFILEDQSWLLFRLSGTEPILRIYAEAPSLTKVKNLLDFGQKFAFSMR